MENNSYIKQIIELNKQHSDRHVFHEKAGRLLVEAANDESFWQEVFKQNLSDKGYLQRKWSMYEIPFFYVYENDDFYVKIHLFVPLRSGEKNIAASAIHHHNNYLLTTYAAFGSGYETLLFEKNPEVDPNSKEVNLKITEHFTQADRPLHIVDAWEPHVVINPASLSATLVLWSPDKKRNTDSLRSNPLLKTFKKPLRKLIYALGMDKKVGIAAKDTYQFYAQDDKYIGILEDEYFAPTRAQVGPDVDDYSVQTTFGFMQKKGFTDTAFFEELKKSPDVPEYYHKWIDKMLNGETIEDTYAKETINIPNKVLTIEEIIETDRKVNAS